MAVLFPESPGKPDDEFPPGVFYYIQDWQLSSCGQAEFSLGKCVSGVAA